jgi:hypothetical protein
MSWISGIGRSVIDGTERISTIRDPLGDMLVLSERIGEGLEES